MARYSYLYRYSVNGGQDWVDLTPAVDSAQTSIEHNLCTSEFKSAKDSASFVLPAAPSVLKENFVKELLGDHEILVEIYAPGPVTVKWGESSAMWGDLKVMWESSIVTFTGYVDRNDVSLRSYPLTASVNVNVKDVSTLHLDDKVDEHLYLKGKTITQLVHTLLEMAGYSHTNDGLATDEERTIDAFVIDKEKAQTYRQYIDTLLFETGGYVLDFDRKGIASIVRIPWDQPENSTLHIVDNPMISDGITTKSALLKEDGVKLTWSNVKWANDHLVYQDSINRQLVDGMAVGEDVENGSYWPDGGELTPTYQNYDASLLDSPYLTRESRKQNEDLSIIAVENVTAQIQATKGGQAFTDWQYPVISEFASEHGLTTNPMSWPTKAWYLLRNNSGETVNLQHFRLLGRVLYRYRKNTMETKDSKKPKEYVSTYIFSQDHAQHFHDFYWHFLQNSRNTITWKEVNSDRGLGDLVRMNHKGMTDTFDAVISGVVTSYIGKTKISSFTAVGVSRLATGVAYPVTKISEATGSAVSVQAAEESTATELDIEASSLIRNVDMRSSNDKKTRITFTLAHKNVVGTKQFQKSTNLGSTWTDVSVNWGNEGTTVEVDFQDNDNAKYMYRIKVESTAKSVTIENNDVTELDKCFGLVLNPSAISERVVSGDYFICSESNDSYSKGCTYVYNGSTPWGLMDATDGSNAKKMLNSLTTLTNSEVDLNTISDANTITWANTVIANKAVIRSLFSENITILNGGSIQSDRFLDDGVTPGFKVESSGEAVFTGVRINGSSHFKGSFDCDVIKTVVNPTETHQFPVEVKKDSAVSLIEQFNAYGLGENIYYECSVTGINSIKYFNFKTENYETSWSESYYWRVQFYAADYSLINLSSVISVRAWDSGAIQNPPGIFYGEERSMNKWKYYGFSPTSSITITITRGGNVIQLSIPNEVEAIGLQPGQMYYDRSSGVLHIKI